MKIIIKVRILWQSVWTLTHCPTKNFDSCIQHPVCVCQSVCLAASLLTTNGNAVWNTTGKDGWMVYNPHPENTQIPKNSAGNYPRLEMISMDEWKVARVQRPKVVNYVDVVIVVVVTGAVGVSTQEQKLFPKQSNSGLHALSHFESGKVFTLYVRPAFGS